jgi:hypothetical protein
MRKNPQYGGFPNRVELGRPRAASRKSMAIGGGKRKWRNAVGFAGSLAAGVELSGCHGDRRCHAELRRSLCRCEWGLEGVMGGVRIFVTWGW